MRLSSVKPDPSQSIATISLQLERSNLNLASREFAEIISRWMNVVVARGMLNSALDRLPAALV
jgi:hypothetical protein